MAQERKGVLRKAALLRREKGSRGAQTDTQEGKDGVTGRADEIGRGEGSRREL